MAPHRQNLFTTHGIHVIQFFEQMLKLPFSVKIHVLLILNETTGGRVFIFVHRLVLAMTND